MTANGTEVGHAQAQIDVTARPFPWQNPVHACDVAGNGQITAQDVLVLINEINRGGARDLPVPPQPAHQPPPFFDVSGDNRLEPVDVLIVINYINLHGAGPISGEAPAAGLRAIPSGGADGAPAEGEQGPVRIAGDSPNAEPGEAVSSARRASLVTDHAGIAADRVFARLASRPRGATQRWAGRWDLSKSVVPAFAKRPRECLLDGVWKPDDLPFAGIDTALHSFALEELRSELAF